MVYGAILEKGNRYYTHLLEILKSIEPIQKDFNWLISNCECYPRDPKTDELLSKEYCFLCGTALTALVEHEDFQWVWAVLSAFEKSLTLDKILAYPYPTPTATLNSGKTRSQFNILSRKSRLLRLIVH